MISLLKNLGKNLEKKLHVMVFLYAIGGLGAYMLSSFLIYEPPHSTYLDEDLAGVGVHFKILTEDKGEITAHYLKHPEAKFTILYSHGNSEDIGMTRPVINHLYERGYSVITYDYRGYGTSRGVPSEGNTYRDIEAVYHFLTKEENIPASKIVLFGRSLGSGPSTELASREPLAGLILDSPFLSMFKIKTVFKMYPVDQFENDKKIAHIESPLLILHGTKDKTVPFWHGQGLYDKASSPKMAVWFKNGGHSNLIKTARESYFAAIDDFIEKIDLSKVPDKQVSFADTSNL